MTSEVYVGSGFPDESMRALPRRLVRTYLTEQPGAGLLVSDAGHFPRAMGHGMRRKKGTDQLVVILCTAGTGRFITPHESFDIERGDVIVVPPRVPHEYYAADDDPWTILWFHAFGQAVPSLVAASGLSAEHPVAVARDPYPLVGLMEEILGHLKRDETQASVLAAAGAAWHMLTSLPLLTRDRTGRHDAVEEVQNLLRARAYSRLPIGDLARAVGLSPSHLSMIFRKRTGQSILEYQTSLRMSRARELLDLTDAPISAIARELGFSDALYFSRVFRAREGSSPTEYRASRKHGQ